jgi:hypothetical protein
VVKFVANARGTLKLSTQKLFGKCYYHLHDLRTGGGGDVKWTRVLHIYLLWAVYAAPILQSSSLNWQSSFKLEVREPLWPCINNE